MLYLLLGVFSITIGILASNAKSAHALYDGGRLIDNYVFLDANSMSRSRIQSFLEARNSGLASLEYELMCYGAGSTERQLYESAGAQCDTEIPASHIIYYASQVYGVNPRVILATLQKEQSLVTATNPTSWQLNQAMGYACPTSGNCEGTSSFPYQIDSGTWALRWHYERANGNNSWWRQSSSWTCGTEKKYYKPNLYPGKNVRFYDENDVHYRTHYIENAATSAFYCYTPHAYNNPDGLYGRSPYGTTGMYYSGSYNFVYWFEEWFGTTFASNFVSSAYDSCCNIEAPEKTTTTYTAVIRFENDGQVTWYDDNAITAYNLQNKKDPVHLRTANDIGRFSMFGSNWNGNQNVPSRTFSKVYADDGVTLTQTQNKVRPGEIAEWEIALTVPEDLAPGTYYEQFRPSLYRNEDEFVGDWATIKIEVLPLFESESYFRCCHVEALPGEIKSAEVWYENTGWKTWYGETLANATGRSKVLLYTADPPGASNSLGMLWNSNMNTPARDFTAVYESDGVTLASNQGRVKRGQIAKYDISFYVPYTTEPGRYRNRLQPGRHGSPYAFNQPHSFIDVVVEDTRFNATVHDTSSHQFLSPGDTANVSIWYKNSGNMKWYDWDAAANESDDVVRTVLYTDKPTGASSPLGALWGPKKNRPAEEFGAVFEADGTTLTANQGIVEPGQIVRFDFTYKVPNDVAKGRYKTFLKPVLKGDTEAFIFEEVFMNVYVD